MNTKRILLLLILSTLTLFAKVEDKWKINAGVMLLADFETDVRIAPKGGPLSININTKDQLGMKNDTGVFRLDGYYRFNDTHSIDFSYFKVTSSGNKVVETTIGVGDKQIALGATVKSLFNMTTYKVDYAYSFYHNDDVELALTAGLHITNIELQIKASRYIGSAPADNSSSNPAAITLPLPVVGFKGEYTIIDEKLFANYRTDYFYFSTDGFEGSLLSSNLNIEYRFVEHVGVGLGYNTNKLFLNAEFSNKSLEIKNTLSGALLYFTYIY